MLGLFQLQFVEEELEGLLECLIISPRFLNSRTEQAFSISSNWNDENKMPEIVRWWLTW